MGDACEQPALIHSRQQYIGGPEATELNTVDIWTNDISPSTKGDGKTWIIYIHGGAWRDPAIDSKTFEPTVLELWKSPKRSSIGAFVSINYRLSPYPSHPDNPSKPDDSSRNAHHPDHMLDVARALLYLEKQYGIANRYILAGHSAGATIAFQLRNYSMKENLPTPAGVIGIAGIYHFEAFVEAHNEIPEYKALMENAFPDHSVWDDSSPAVTALEGPALWEQSELVVLSYSDEDELVEKWQVTAMLRRAGTVDQAEEKVHLIDISGKHDEVWENGNLLGGLILKSMELLRIRNLNGVSKRMIDTLSVIQ